jgi:hypothetical protein
LNKQIEELQKTLADSKEGSRRYELWLKEQIATLTARINELEDDLDTAIRMGRDLAGSKDLRIKELDEMLTAQKEGV